MGFLETLKKLFGINRTPPKARPQGEGWKWDTEAIREAHLYQDALPDLTGSPKQIAWAQKIRDPQVNAIHNDLYRLSRGADAALVPIALPIVKAHLGQTEARYWIANRDEPCENLILVWKLREIASQQQVPASEEKQNIAPASTEKKSSQGTAEKNSMFHRFLTLFGTSEKSVAPSRIPPSHADGKPMNSKEKHAWTMLQKVLDAHRDDIERNKGPGVYTPSKGYRGVLVNVDGLTKISCICASGEWEATFKDGVVGVPRRINDG